MGAIVVGPGLPQVGFERAAMREYFDATGRDGFAYAMLFPGMQRVIQAAGRVHRTPEDRGVIVLLDQRFARSPYRDCLPSAWVAGRRRGPPRRRPGPGPRGLLVRPPPARPGGRRLGRGPLSRRRIARGRAPRAGPSGHIRRRM